MCLKMLHNQREITRPNEEKIEDQRQRKDARDGGGDQVLPRETLPWPAAYFAGEPSVAGEPQGKDEERLADVAVEQKTAGKNKNGKVLPSTGGDRCSRHQQTEERCEQHERRPAPEQAVIARHEWKTRPTAPKWKAATINASGINHRPPASPPKRAAAMMSAALQRNAVSA